MYSVQRIVTDDTSQLVVVEEMPWRIERERADATEHTNIGAAAIPERRTDFGFVSGWVVLQVTNISSKSSKSFDTRLPPLRSVFAASLSLNLSISEGWQRENESVSIMWRRRDYDYVYIFCFHVCKLLHASSLEFM